MAYFLFPFLICAISGFSANAPSDRFFFAVCLPLRFDEGGMPSLRFQIFNQGCTCVQRESLGEHLRANIQIPLKAAVQFGGIKGCGQKPPCLGVCCKVKTKEERNVLKHPSCCGKCSVPAGDVGTLKITRCKKGDNGFLPLSCICSMPLSLKIKPEERSETCLSITSCQPSQPVPIFGCCQSVRLRAHYMHGVFLI